MLVDWNPVARAALRSILDFISQRNALAAQRLFDAIATATEALPQHPYLYRPGRVPGTREMVSSPQLHRRVPRDPRNRNLERSARAPTISLRLTNRGLAANA